MVGRGTQRASLFFFTLVCLCWKEAKPLSISQTYGTRSKKCEHYQCKSPVKAPHLSAVECTTSEVDPRHFRSDSSVLAQAALIGIVSGLSVSMFKLGVSAVKRFCYGASSILPRSASFRPLIPALGGLLVGCLVRFGISPGLKGFVEEVDDETMDSNSVNMFRSPLHSLRKAMAAIVTLGSGCSLGPEGPSVDLGMAVARFVANILPNEKNLKLQSLQRKRLLLACGAAAGVAAGFEAPLAGVFFALEIVRGVFPPLPLTEINEQENRGLEVSLTSSTRNIGALLLSSVLAALVARSLLGKHAVFVLSEYQLKAPLAELPLYMLLGAFSGLAAFTFKQTATRCTSFFQGDLGPKALRRTMTGLPNISKPALGGLLCGVVGLAFPEILFLGYDTLNSLLANSSLPTPFLLSLLGVKGLMTAISTGSGLIGGTFAPSLFLGAMVGGAFHNVVGSLIQGVAGAGSLIQISDVPAYAMVGSGSVLAALFRAPLTASLLMFELTRDYDVILPLMASAAVGCVVNDIIESKFTQRKLQRYNEAP